MRKYYEPVPRGEHRPWQERRDAALPPSSQSLSDQDRETLFRWALALEAEGQEGLALIALDKATR